MNKQCPFHITACFHIKCHAASGETDDGPHLKDDYCNIERNKSSKSCQSIFLDKGINGLSLK